MKRKENYARPPWVGDFRARHPVSPVLVRVLLQYSTTTSLLLWCAGTGVNDAFASLQYNTWKRRVSDVDLIEARPSRLSRDLRLRPVLYPNR